MPQFFRSICIIAALLASAAEPISALAQGEPAPPAPAAPGVPQRPQPIAFDFTAGWSDLQQLADMVRVQSNVPGVALAVVRDGKIVDVVVSGTTSLAGGRSLTPDDSFEWGSLTKSVTGTVIARLIADGQLSPQSTIASILPDVAMREEYRDVTLAQLMRHESGLPPYTQLTPQIAARIRAYTGTSAEKRLAFVKEVLQEDPAGPPGGQFLYSNADVTVAAAMAEHVTGKPWEELVREDVFAPAGMAGGSFGAPATSEHADATRGHLARPGQPLQPAPFGMYAEVQDVLGPSGFVSSPIGDMARYAIFQLAGERDGAGGIPADVFEMIHSADPTSLTLPGSGGHYNYGWGIPSEGILPGHTSYWHNGSDGTFYAELHVVPDLGLAVMIMVNSGGPISVSSRPVLAEMARRYAT